VSMVCDGHASRQTVGNQDLCLPAPGTSHPHYAPQLRACAAGIPWAFSEPDGSLRWCHYPGFAGGQCGCHAAPLGLSGEVFLPAHPCQSLAVALCPDRSLLINQHTDDFATSELLGSVPFCGALGTPLGAWPWVHGRSCRC
jgi:hypothetical protein